MKKVLIITYYWPPINSAGVYRWLKFVKYLREFNWEPVVYTIERQGYDPNKKYSKDIPEGVTVLTQPIFDPFDYYQAIVGKGKKKTQPGFINEKGGSSSLRKLLFRIRGNLFIPDAKKYWVGPSVRYLTKYVSENKIDVVVSTGPPHSMHLIGLGIKKAIGTKWIADFRDPWTNIDFYERLGLSKRADKKHKALEGNVIAAADGVVTVSWDWAQEMEKDHGKRIHVITNGYDEEDFVGFQIEKEKKFTILQAGSMNEDRDPKGLWEALSKLLDKPTIARDNVAVKLIGPVDHGIVQNYCQAGLNDIILKSDIMEHDLAIKKMMEAHVMLLPINDSKNMAGIIPGKLYEYLRTGNPILCIGSTTGDSAKIILEANAGVVHEHGDVEGILNSLTLFHNQYLAGELGTSCSNISKYQRRLLTKELAELLDGL